VGYKSCPHCRSDKGGTRILHCDSCNLVFCFECTTNVGGAIFNIWGCPRCLKDENSTIGEIEEADSGDDSGSGYSSSFTPSPTTTNSSSDLTWFSHPAVSLIASGLCFGIGYLLLNYTHKFSLAWWIGLISSLAGIPAVIAFIIAAFASLTTIMIICFIVAILCALVEYFSKHLY